MANEKVYVGEKGAKELYRRIKRLINNFGGFEEAQGTGADNHPSVLNPSTKIIYLVPIDSSTAPNKFTEWYYHIDSTTQAGSWETLGVTNFVENSWKHWSEEHGSTSADSTETSVYIGKNNTITAGSDGNHYVIGAENSLRSGFIFGQSNTANNLRALIVGSSNTSTSYDTIIIGNQNAAADYGSAVFGYSNTLTKGHDCSIFGSENTLNEDTANNSQSSTIHGRANVARDFYISDLFGSSNQCFQDSTSIFNIKGGHTERNYVTSIFGQSISAYDNRLSSIVGYNNTVSKMFESIVMGVSVKATSLSSSTEGTGNVIIAAYNGEIPIQASCSALVFGYGGSAHGSYNAIFGIAPRVGDTSVSGSAGESNYNAGIAGMATTIKPQSSSNLFLTTYETIHGSSNVVIDQYGHTVGDNNISIGQYNSIGEYTPTKRISSIAIGRYNSIQRDHATVLGESNTITFNDNTNYSTSHVVALGQYNVATNAANAYQFGRSNSVTGNALPDTENTQSSSLHHTLAVNIGRDNGVNGEGVNVGKFNHSTVGGSTFGQFNYASNGSTAVGERCTSYIGSATFGKYNLASSGAFAIGTGATAYNGAIAFGSSSLYADSGAFAIGFGNYQSDSSTRSEVNSGSVAFIADTLNRWSTSSFTKSRISEGSFGIGSYNTISETSIGIGACNTVSKHAVAIGVENQCTYESFAVGSSNKNIGYLDGSTECGHGYAFGYDNHDVYSDAFAVGIKNANIVGMASAFGIGNISVTDNSSAFGHNNHVVDDCSFVVGSGNNNVTGGSQVLGSYNNTINDGSIALGISNAKVINSSTAIGIANYACNGSVAIGVANNSAGGVFSMGIANIAAPEYSDHPTDYDTWKDSFHGNAAVIGLGNRIKNIRDSWHSGDMSPSERRNTFGVAVGAYITAYGHNIIALGFGHTIGDPATWFDDTEATTDNDGFMTAIGYKCEAFRNFDTAIGYKSVAKGGENLAITNSTAIGYRNLAYNHSTVSGINNVALNESYYTCSNPDNSQLANKYNCFNRLDDAAVTFTSTYPADEYNSSSIIGNTFTHVAVEIQAGFGGVHSNFITANGKSQYSYHILQASAVSGNMFFQNGCVKYDNPTYSGSNTPFGLMLNNPNGNTSSIENNFAAHTMACVTGFSHFSRNMTYASQITIHGNDTSTNYSPFRDNVILHSHIDGTGYRYNSNGQDISENILAGRSKLDITNASGSVTYNVGMSGAIIVAHDDCFSPNQSLFFGNETCTHNFAVGSQLVGTQCCVSFGDNTEDNDAVATYIANSLRIRNFGDNVVLNSSDSFISGTLNKLNFAQKTTILGERNNIYSDIYGQASSSNRTRSTSIGKLSDIGVFGSENTIRQIMYDSHSFSRLYVFGCKNNLYGTNMHDCMVVGGYNDVGNLQSMPSEISFNDLLNVTVSTDTYYKLSTSGWGLSPTPQKTSVRNNKTYIYLMGAIDAESAPSGVTPIDISGNDFVAQVRAKTLVDGKYYHVISSPSQEGGQDPEVSELGTIYSDDMALKRADGSIWQISGQTHNLNSQVFVFGGGNPSGSRQTVDSRVNQAVVFGNCNQVHNSMLICTSGDFVQGNNNTANDGSNIICMGNGNVSTGHNSVAIGCQLKSDKWQTVIGKYNIGIDGPERLASQSPQDPTKALFIVGNGYSTKDNSDWQDEQYITRSNALELYANGDLKVTGDVTANNIPAAPTQDGEYMLKCTVSNGTKTYAWVAMNSTTV